MFFTVNCFDYDGCRDEAVLVADTGGDVMAWVMVAGDGRLKKKLQRLNWLVVMEMYDVGSMGLVTFFLIGVE